MNTPDELAAIRQRAEEIRSKVAVHALLGEDHRVAVKIGDLRDLYAALDAVTAERDKWQANFNAALGEVRADTDKLLAAESRETALKVRLDAAQQRIAELEAALREVTRTFGDICDLTDGHDWCVTCEAIHSMAVEAFDQLRNGKPAERKL